MNVALSKLLAVMPFLFGIGFIAPLIAQLMVRFDVTAPFWFAFAGSAVFLVVIWRELRHLAHADEADAPLNPDDDLERAGS